MIEAHNMNMTAGDYAFFSVNPFDSKYFGDPSWYRQSDSDETNKQAREAYRALMTIQLYSEKSEHYDQFAAKVKEKALAEFGYDFDANGEQVHFIIHFFLSLVMPSSNLCSNPPLLFFRCCVLQYASSCQGLVFQIIYGRSPHT